MDCPFNIVLKKVVQHVLNYPHLIILQAIIEAPIVGEKKMYMSVEKICNATNLHTRDAMKYIHQLVSCGFLDSCTTSLDKRRIHVWGINYKKVFHLLYLNLSTIHDRLQKKANQSNAIYCTNCNQYYAFEDALNASFIVCCPINQNHQIETNHVSSQCEIQLIKKLKKSIENLKDQIPKYSYSCHLNLSSVGEDLAI